MPYNLAPYNQAVAAIGAKDEHYDYGEIDISPNSELSKHIVSECMKRAHTGRDAIKSKFDTWHRLDEVQTSYRLLSEKEREQQVTDENRPVAIVIPASLAILDTLVTYNLAALGEAPFYRYRAVSPEDTVAVLKLQALIELQSMHFNHLCDLHTQIRDSLMYGFGMIVPRWDYQHGMFPTKQQAQMAMGIDGDIVPTKATYDWQDRIIYEGHRLDAIDSYNAILDPNVPSHKVQQAGYVGWIIRHDYMDLLAMEQDGAQGFRNVRYLKHCNCLSAMSEEGRDSISSTTKPANISSVDVVYLYVKIIPKDWKLGTSERPEIWVFGIAGDSIVILAKPSGLRHGMFPVAIAAPESDGHSILPTSKMECILPSQVVLDFEINSRVLAQRKGVGGTIVMDPGILNLRDMKRSGPKIVCVRSSHWGRGVEKSWEQIPQDNSTAQNLQDAQTILDLMHRATGATDAVQGVIRGGSERRTAREFEGTKNSAVSRLQRSSKMFSEQSMQPLAYILALQTQQFASTATNVRILGALSEQLEAEFSGQESMIVNPEDIMVPFDTIPYDSTIPGGESLDGWMPIVQSILANPQSVAEILQKKDPSKVIDHYMRELGAKNISSFNRSRQEQQQRQLQATIMPDEQVRSEVQKGNMVPTGQEGLSL